MFQMHRLRCSAALALILLVACCQVLSAQAANKKPNIVIIWGDDIGVHNISAYTMA